MRGLPPEDRLVERLASRYKARRRDVLLGIGDDAAVIQASGPLAISNDVLVEGIDFLSDTDPARLGRKALAVNLSDLAAMGAAPLHALLALGMPPRTSLAWFDAFHDGFRAAAAEYGVAVIGGDLSASPTLFASVTVLGRPAAAGLLTRSGAAAGDELWISGTLGAASAGLQLLLQGCRLVGEEGVRGPSGRLLRSPHASEIRRLIRHQLSPRPMVELGTTLAEKGLATAAIDISDGLARDLHRLCRASGTGAVVERDALPADSAIPELSARLGMDPVATALYGGEDYGLLFSVPRQKAAAVTRLAGRFALRRIGTVTGGPAVLLAAHGRTEAIPDAGFDHFSKAPA
jgi:thiamine-monophosphate kinase